MPHMEWREVRELYPQKKFGKIANTTGMVYIWRVLEKEKSERSESLRPRKKG